MYCMGIVQTLDVAISNWTVNRTVPRQCSSLIGPHSFLRSQVSRSYLHNRRSLSTEILPHRLFLFMVPLVTRNPCSQSVGPVSSPSPVTQSSPIVFHIIFPSLPFFLPSFLPSVRSFGGKEQQNRGSAIGRPTDFPSS